MSALEITDVRRVRLGDHDTEVALHGEGGETFVLLHAVGLSWRMWHDTMAAFPTSVRTVACDLRGHGLAATTPPTTLERHADDVRDLLDALRIERAHVVGLSYGGAVAQHVVLRHPARVASLGLVATFSRAPSETLLERARSAETAGIASQLDGTLSRWFSPQELAENGPRVRYARARLAANRVENWVAAWRALAALDVTHRLREISLPATVIAGAHDTSTTAESMCMIARAMPDAEFHIIAEGHHLLALEQPAQLAALLTARMPAEDHA